MFVVIFPIEKGVSKDELYISTLYPGDEDQLY